MAQQFNIYQGRHNIAEIDDAIDKINNLKTINSVSLIGGGNINTPDTKHAGGISIDNIDDLTATTVQSALQQIYAKAKESGMSDTQIATAIANYLASHPIEGVAEAPKDGKEYVRKDGLWTEVTTGGEANVQSDWNETDATKSSYILNKPTIPTQGISDAPTDGKQYVRKDGAWVEVVSDINWNEQSYNMEVCIDGDTLLALGETKHITFRVFRGFDDVTDTVDEWKIIRTSSNTQADAVWGARDKVNTFNALTKTSDVSIDITWSDDPALNDLDPDDTVSGTVFKVTATTGTDKITQTIDF